MQMIRCFFSLWIDSNKRISYRWFVFEWKCELRFFNSQSRFLIFQWDTDFASPFFVVQYWFFLAKKTNEMKNQRKQKDKKSEKKTKDMKSVSDSQDMWRCMLFACATIRMDNKLPRCERETRKSRGKTLAYMINVIAESERTKSSRMGEFEWKQSKTTDN